MLSLEKVFPPLEYRVPRPKKIGVIEVNGMTTSQIPPSVFDAVDRTHTLARSPRNRIPPSKPVLRSPRPTPTVQPTVGELLRGGPSAVRLQRSLQSLVETYPNFDGESLKQLRVAFESRASTAPTTTGGMVDIDDFCAALQSVFAGYVSHPIAFL